MDDWKNNSIWFDQLPAGRFANIDLKASSLDGVPTRDLAYLILWHHRSKAGNLTDTPLPQGLSYLELNWSNLKDFTGVDQLSDLKRLELHYCTKLASDAGLAEVAGTLEHLHIGHAKNFVPGEALLSLKNLRVLCLNACGELESLSFLSQLPHLIDVRFVHTNVLDGDLSPLVDHPTIRSAGYLNKRHYTIKPDRMDALLAQKHGGRAFRREIQDGERATFRYLD